MKDLNQQRAEPSRDHGLIRAVSLILSGIVLSCSSAPPQAPSPAEPADLRRTAESPAQATAPLSAASPRDENVEAHMPQNAPPQIVGGFTKDALKVARDTRRLDTRRFGDMTQDALLMVEQCPEPTEAAAARVFAVVGVLDQPWDHAAGLVAVAEVAAERALAAQSASTGCSVVECSYWARDEAGGGDYVVRYSAAPDQPTALWWVPDSGAARRAELADVPTRVFSARLLRGAAHFLGIEADPKTALELVGRASALDPTNAQVAEVRAELVGQFNPALAVDGLRSFISTHGATADLQATLAELLEELGEAESASAARELVDAALAMAPANAKALALRAEWRREAGDAKGAVADLRALRDAHPSLDAARYPLAVALDAAGSRDDARMELDAFLQIWKEDAQALVLRASWALDAQQKAVAAADLALLRRIATDAPEVEALSQRLVALSAESQPKPSNAEKRGEEP